MQAPPSALPSPDAGPRIGEWLSEAFTLFGQQWQVWVLQTLIYSLLLAVPVFIGTFFGPFGFFLGAMAGAATSTTEGSVIGAVGGALAVLFAGVVVAVIIQYYCFAGMKRTAAKQLRGEPITIGDLFSGGDVFWSVLGASLLVGIIQGIGVLLCGVPFLIFGGLLCLTLPLVVDQRLGPIEAMQRSWEATKPQIWMWTVWYLLIYLILTVGGSTGIGIFVVVPLQCLALMIAYRDTIGLPGALPPAGAIPVVPPQPMVHYGPAGPPVAGGTCPACGRAVAAGAVQCPFCQAALPGPQGP